METPPELFQSGVGEPLPSSYVVRTYHVLEEGPPAEDFTITVWEESSTRPQVRPRHSIIEYESFQTNSRRLEPKTRRRQDHNVKCASQKGRSQYFAPWYLNWPKEFEEGHPEYLCNTCRHIDFDYLFSESEFDKTSDPEIFISLGELSEIAGEQSCSFCILVFDTIITKLERGQDGNIILDQKSLRLLSAKWYLSPSVYWNPSYRRGYQLFLRPNVHQYQGDAEREEDSRHLSPSWPFALRLITNKRRGGRYVPKDHLDFEWIKTTIALCELNTDMPEPNFPHPVRVIDVENMCIVDLTSDKRYVALSYCWGKVKMSTLVQENEASLRIPCGLSKLPDIPQTMQDAIVLVRNVGERYLWIDCLCILQDSEIDLQQQLEQMAWVFLNAYFTIFAISGQDANYGLPGVRPGTRKLKQFVQKVGHLAIASSLPWMEDHDLLQSGAWGTRAWTFQERFKSQRGVFIGDNGTIINCSHTYSPEDEHCWHALTTDDGEIADGQMRFFAGQDKRCKPYLHTRTPFDLYCILISEYTQRSLTYQKDAEKAFGGIFYQLGKHLKTGFISGLPEAEFDAALLWSPIGSSIRRCDPETKEPLFPSWSWLGWIGHAAYPWTLERDAPMSIDSSPLKWRDAVFASLDRTPGLEEARIHDVSFDERGHQKQLSTVDESWFTSDDNCPFSSPDRSPTVLRMTTQDHLGVRRLCVDPQSMSMMEWLIYIQRQKLYARKFLLFPSKSYLS
jgi:hypothetical protein